MDDTDKFIGTGLGSTPQEPVALIAYISDSGWSALESNSEGRGGLGRAAEPDTMAAEIRYCMSIKNSPTFLFVTSRLL